MNTLINALGTAVLVAVLAAAFAFCAGPARADGRVGPVLEVFGCAVMTADQLECRREWYAVEGVPQDCENIATALRTNSGIIEAVCHFEH